MPHAGAGQGEAEGALPLKPGWPDTTLVISHSKRMAVNAAANRALAPEGSKLLELETHVIHIDLGCHETVPQVPHGFCQTGCYESVPTANCQTATTQNSPQSMRVWPGLRLIGAGGKIPKGVFVAVAEVEPDAVRLDNGMRLKNQELLRATRPSHAVTYASCQGLTLHNRVRLDLESCHLTLRHLYVGASRATSSELLLAHLEEHAPLSGHQPHVPGLHKRAAPAARELRGARHAVAGGVPEEAALQVHLALHVLALGAHLDGALQLALKLGAGDPRKGLLEDDHVVDDGLLHPIRPRPQVGVARKAHAHPLGPVVLEVAGLPSTSTSALHTSAP